MVLGFRPHTNRPVQLQRWIESLKFLIKEDEELYYLCSENKGDDQLHGYCEADLCLCFRIGKNPNSHDTAQMPKTQSVNTDYNIKPAP